MIWVLAPVVAGIAIWAFEQVLFEIEEYQDWRGR
jgi:hypothetical protein